VIPEPYSFFIDFRINYRKIWIRRKRLFSFSEGISCLIESFRIFPVDELMSNSCYFLILVDLVIKSVNHDFARNTSSVNSLEFLSLSPLITQSRVRIIKTHIHFQAMSYHLSRQHDSVSTIFEFRVPAFMETIFIVSST